MAALWRCFDVLMSAESDPEAVAQYAALGAYLDTVELDTDRLVVWHPSGSTQLRLLTRASLHILELAAVLDDFALALMHEAPIAVSMRRVPSGESWLVGYHVFELSGEVLRLELMRPLTKQHGWTWQLSTWSEARGAAVMARVVQGDAWALLSTGYRVGQRGWSRLAQLSAASRRAAQQRHTRAGAVTPTAFFVQSEVARTQPPIFLRVLESRSAAATVLRDTLGVLAFQLGQAATAAWRADASHALSPWRAVCASLLDGFEAPSTVAL